MSNIPSNACSPCPYYDGECMCENWTYPKDALCYEEDMEEDNENDKYNQKINK